jgi:hypothetical protein
VILVKMKSTVRRLEARVQSTYAALSLVITAFRAERMD